MSGMGLCLQHMCQRVRTTAEVSQLVSELECWWVQGLALGSALLEVQPWAKRATKTEQVMKTERMQRLGHRRLSIHHQLGWPVGMGHVPSW